MLWSGRERAEAAWNESKNVRLCSLFILAARQLARLESLGQPIELADLFIGCAALGRGMTLVTWNVEHFRRIEGLRVVTPREILG